jgi:hypothetical protein
MVLKNSAEDPAGQDVQIHRDLKETRPARPQRA